jgi:hypothetical protein
MVPDVVPLKRVGCAKFILHTRKELLRCLYVKLQASEILRRILLFYGWSTYHKYIESGRYGKVDLERMQENVNGVFVRE